MLRLYPHKIPFWVRYLFPDYVWNIPVKEKELYLTFDDGPHPGVTDKILSLLNRHKAHATFFCSGKQAEQHPGIIQEIIRRGHRIGSHGYAHLNGWKVSRNAYQEDLIKAEQILTKYVNSKLLFRPPYGKISFRINKEFIQRYHKTVIWSHNSGDFDKNVNINQSIQRLKKAPSGSIILFHDNRQAYPQTIKILPPLLSYWESEGYEFKHL